MKRSPPHPNPLPHGGEGTKQKSPRGGGEGTKLQHRAAFTLVELLVALGLVSLLMLLFAEVFQLATGTMSKQRGVMENDQRARVLTTVFGNDIGNRSTRVIIPFQPGEVDYATATYYSFDNRQGFFSISENEPDSDTDDVLHFTTKISAQFSGDTASHDELYYGRAGNLDDYPDGGVFTILDSNNDPNYPYPYPYPNAPIGTIVSEGHPNQPKADEGLMDRINSTATSRSAEIVFFLRNGNLYRRVMLIREPLNSTFDAQPRMGSLGTGDDLFNLDSSAPLNKPIYYPSGRDFLKEFDFSARFQTDASGNPLGARFIGGGGVGISGLYNGVGGSLFPIASPLNRFGHNPIVSHDNGSGATASVGNPREYLDPDPENPASLFLGRFTHQETSDEDFNFPHSPSAFGTIGVPTDPVDTPGGTLDDANNDHVVDQFDDGLRRGEDILMTHVHSFDVKVWDEALGQYMDVGHANAAGDFYQTWNSTTRQGNARQTYGPRSADSSGVFHNRTFDTWHPGFDANNDGSIDNDDRPPFLPKQIYINDPLWTSAPSYSIGDYVKPTSTTAVETFRYRCSATTTGMPIGTRGATEPTWPVNHLGTVTDGELTWQAEYNLKRLRSIQITIRYFDVTSEQMRQVTLIQSLMD